MPKLGKKKLKYDKEGMKAYIKALKKKRKKEDEDAPTLPTQPTPHGGY